jgi:hypothetical protein
MAEPTAALEHRIRLAHQARRAKEHQLDDIRRALCDIGLMQDSDPFSHADLADVIRRNGVSASRLDICGHPGHPADSCQPCMLPLGHGMHRDADGCSWPAGAG